MSKRDLIKYAKSYKNLPFEPTMVEYRRKVVIENLLKYEHNKILEIGCGTEPLFKYFSDYTSMTIVEPCHSFYQNACKLKSNNNITIYNDLFENVIDKLKQSSYDLIIISCLLHELPNNIDFLKKVHEICNSKTILHINVPNANSFHRVLAFEMGIIDSIYQDSSLNVKMQQNTVFDMKSLTDTLVKNNFKVVETGSYFIKLFTHEQMERLIKSKIIDKKLLDGLFKITKYIPDLGSEIFVNCSIKKAR